MMEIARERGLSEDPRVRQKLAASYADIEIFRLTQMRVLSRVSAGGVPGPEGSVLKLFWSELSQRLQQTAAEIAGVLNMTIESVSNLSRTGDQPSSEHAR